jgi:M6 family metalloprotease-like protein
MRARTVLAALVAVILVLISTVTTPSAQPPADGERAFSAVPLSPVAVQALRAKGKGLRLPFPNSINRGRKFVPGGNVVGSLETATTQNVLVIFVKFTNAPPGGPVERLNLSTYFDTLLFGTKYTPPEYQAIGTPEVDYPTDRTLFKYFQAVSYNRVEVTTANMPSALGWADSEHSYEYYCPGDYGFGAYPHNAQGLVVDAIRAVDELVDFSAYAVDGEVPNLFVVHAGTGAEWNSDPSLLWSHSWSLDAYTGLPAGGIVVDGVRVNNYAMMPEVGGDLTGVFGPPPAPYPPTVGVYAHEYGHVLGLPDQYDYGYESEGTSIYSLMAGGSWNQWPLTHLMFSGNSPSFLDAWSRYRLGFVTPTVVEGRTSASLPPAETHDVVYKMVVPNSDGKEYFLLENRQQIGFDQGLDVYGVPGGELVRGLAIYHIDDVVLSRNYWRPNEAENWKEFRSEGWRRAANGETHYGISIIQADGLWDLEHGLITRFTRDLYPGSLGRTSFGNFTSPNSSAYYFWAGSAPKFGLSGVTVEDIVERGGVITATLRYAR